MPDGFFSLNNPNFLDIMMRFVINLFFLFILIKVVYFRYTKKEKFLFTFFLMGIVVFFICSMLRSVFIEFGMAVGLFAVFAILRFRTRNFSIKDMAYIFTSIGVSLINSLKLLKFPLLGVLIINGIIILAAYILEEFVVRNNSESYIITYENMELLRPDKKQKLLKDVSSITGKEILKVKIRRVDYKREVARLEIFYKE
ncbi:MAG: DUF4956 domain-containing protein [Bacteroidetes bacterium]|nr:MAG: DUF4956 domain-containing protein [Bacteroidota bacterium]